MLSSHLSMTSVMLVKCSVSVGDYIRVMRGVSVLLAERQALASTLELLFAVL